MKIEEFFKPIVDDLKAAAAKLGCHQIDVTATESGPNPGPEGSFYGLEIKANVGYLLRKQAKKKAKTVTKKKGVKNEPKK